MEEKFKKTFMIFERRIMLDHFKRRGDSIIENDTQ